MTRSIPLQKPQLFAFTIPTTVGPLSSYSESSISHIRRISTSWHKNRNNERHFSTTKRSRYPFKMQISTTPITTEETSSSSIILTTDKQSDNISPSDAIFQCPSCESPLPPISPQQMEKLPSKCPNCLKSFPQRRGYVDLTPTSTLFPQNISDFSPGKTLFQSPIVSFSYERGWRDMFARAGFPGIETERDMFLDYVLPASTILDLSCGSGLMARQLASYIPSFYRVVAADYSDAMLNEAVAQVKSDVKAPQIDFIRADVVKLPFQDSSFDAVHAGAAIHCWPKLQDGLSEVYRILKPNAPFFATTFLKGAYVPGSRADTPSTPLKLARRLVTGISESRSPFRFFEEEQLNWLFRAAGFVDVEIDINKGFVVVKGRKK